jgi:hypothetical protein
MNIELLALVLALFGTVLFIVALRRFWNARIFSGGSSMVVSLLFFACAATLFAVATNLHTYARLTFEQPIAELRFALKGPQRFEATLTRLPDGDMQVFMINGDEWQLDARVLKWQGWANIIGLNAQYRLERLSGRYLDIEQERTAARSVYGLTDNPGWDIWTWGVQYPKWLPFVDATYGSATYLPMTDKARYRVTLSQTGLLARPVNSEAMTASGNQSTSH